MSTKMRRIVPGKQEIKKKHWSYDDDESGPNYWKESFAPAAKGLHQSPINIESDKAVYSALICSDQLNLHYVPADCRTLTNNGHTIQVTLDQRNTGNYLSSWMLGGPLKHKYKLEQFHFHWGSSANDGTEHALDGVRFASELHLVHWNCELFPTFSDAVRCSCGLAVLTVFIKEGGTNPFLQKLLDFLPKISYGGDKVELTRGFDPSTLLPNEKRKYFTYSGSLTTPPCYESARFIIYADFIEASKQQMQLLRDLNCNKKGEPSLKMTCNCRPLQPVNDRIVVKSFR